MLFLDDTNGCWQLNIELFMQFSARGPFINGKVVTILIACNQVFAISGKSEMSGCFTIR